jgi:hypothetical protein
MEAVFHDMSEKGKPQMFFANQSLLITLITAAAAPAVYKMVTEHMQPIITILEMAQ